MLSSRLMAFVNVLPPLTVAMIVEALTETGTIRTSISASRCPVTRLLTSVTPVTPVAASVAAKRPCSSTLRRRFGRTNDTTHPSSAAISVYGLPVALKATLTVEPAAAPMLIVESCAPFVNGHCATTDAVNLAADSPAALAANTPALAAVSNATASWYELA